MYKGTEGNWIFMICRVTIALSLLLSAKIYAEATEIAYLGLDDSDTWQVWVMTSSGQHAKQVTHSTKDKLRVSWYPDGKKLFVNAIDGQLYQVDLSDGTETPIQTPSYSFQDAVLSPDGQHFAYSLSTTDGMDANNIWIRAEDGADTKKLTASPWLQHEPAWGPDGNVIYFLSGSGGQTHDIWRVSLDDLDTMQVTSNQVYHFDIAIAADGTLAFSNNRKGDYNIWTRSTDGDEYQLTDSSALDARPSWSPNGRYIVFESTRQKGPDIWRIDISTGEIMRLTHTQGRARYPVWFQGKTKP